MQQTTGQLKLNKIDLTDVPDITVLNPNFDKLDTEVTKIKNDKVDKVSGKSLSTNDYTNEEKTKLANVASNANNYTHPTSHPPSIMTQDANNRLVTDSEKSTWNSKAPTTPVTTNTNGLMSKEDKSKLDGVATGANRIILNNTITSTSTSEGATANVVKVVNDTLLTHSSNTTSHVTANERTIWSSKASTSVATTTSNGLMAKEDKIKLNGVATGANNYVHPAAHPPTIITQDAAHRFATDTEKSTWNGKTDMQTVRTFVDTSINSHDIGWSHHDMIGYYSDLVDKKETIVEALNSHTEKITVLSDRGFLSQEKFVSGNLIDYIKNIPVGKSISVYVGTHNVSNIPASGGFFLMQLFRNSSTGDCHIQAQEFVGNNLTGNQWVADLWNFTDDKIHWERVLTEDNGIIKGLDNDLDNNRGIRLLKSDTQIEPTADMYSKGHMELRTLGAIPILGFHTQGKSACSLYEKNGRLHIIGNDDKGGQLATTDKIDISFLNGWTLQVQGFQSNIVKNGNTIIINTLIYNPAQASSNALIFNIPLPYRPSKPVILNYITDRSEISGVVIDAIGDVKINGIVPAHAWISIYGSINL